MEMHARQSKHAVNYWLYGSETALDVSCAIHLGTQALGAGVDVNSR